MLPGNTFVRTFLRTYAEQLGLDPHRLVEEYRASHEPQNELEGSPLGRPPAMRDRERRRSGPVRPGPVGLVVVVAVIALLVVLGTTGDDDGTEQASPDTDLRLRGPR